MAMKRKKAEEGGASWMDTYGDLVTLLFCFFVLLYSMSSVDQEKWVALVKAFNKDDGEGIAAVLLQEQETEGNEIGVPEDANLTMDVEDLYLELKKAAKEQNVEGQTEIKKGDGYTFVSFQDKIFFDGESWRLRDEGKRVLDSFSKILKKVDPKIQEIQIIGHTSQGDPVVQNTPRTDRTLSALRSAEVIIYLQEKGVVKPEKLVSVSYGQFRPIATFKTVQGRAKNRRVEMLIIGNGVKAKGLEEYYGEVYKK